MSKKGFTKVGFYISNDLLNCLNEFKENYSISYSAAYNLLINYGLRYDKINHVPTLDELNQRNSCVVPDSITIISEV